MLDSKVSRADLEKNPPLSFVVVNHGGLPAIGDVRSTYPQAARRLPAIGDVSTGYRGCFEPAIGDAVYRLSGMFARC